MRFQHSTGLRGRGTTIDYEADLSTASAQGAIVDGMAQLTFRDDKGRIAKIVYTEEEALQLYRIAVAANAVERHEEQFGADGEMKN